MLGDKIGEESGKVTSQRVLTNPGGTPKMETSFHATGSLLGVGHKTTGTYYSIVRPDGTLFGEGQGIVMSKEGDMATWVGQGMATIKKDGSVSYRGAIYYQTSATKWARLNRLPQFSNTKSTPKGTLAHRCGNGNSGDWESDHVELY